MEVFFDGEISDGKACMRVFGFDLGVRRRLLDYQAKEDAVLLSHCEVKRVHRGDQLEGLVTKFTEVEKSGKSFDVGKDTKYGDVVCTRTLHKRHSLFQRCLLKPRTRLWESRLATKMASRVWS